MLGNFDIISVDNSIAELTMDNGNKQQLNSFLVHMDADLNIKTVNEYTVKLFDTVTNDYINCYVSYSRRDITIAPKVQMIPGRKYTIQLLSGESGLKDVLGYALDESIIYDIIFNNKVMLKKPIIMSPADNSTISSILVTIDYNDADSAIVEIDDNIEFSDPLYSEEVFVDTFTPAPKFEAKQYYLRAKAKQTFVDETTGDTIVAESEYTKPIQFFLEYTSEAPSPTSSGIFPLKMKPDNGESMISSNTITILYNTDLSQYNVSAKVYESENSMYEFYKDNAASFIDAELLTECTGTTLVSKSLVVFKLDKVSLNSAYYVRLTISDDSSTLVDDVYTFTTSPRYLYIDYDYIKSDVQNFDVDRQYVITKIQKACDMADYVSLAKIRPENVLYKQKEYVRYKALLDMVVDYQLGYIQLVGGSIGSFSFQVNNSNVMSIESAIKQLQANLQYWERTLKGYERPGNALPDYAQRDQANGPSRTGF